MTQRDSGRKRQQAVSDKTEHRERGKLEGPSSGRRPGVATTRHPTEAEAGKRPGLLNGEQHPGICSMETIARGFQTTLTPDPRGPPQQNTPHHTLNTHMDANYCALPSKLRKNSKRS